MTTHPSPETIDRLLGRSLEPHEIAATLRHIETCEVCVAQHERRFGADIAALAASFEALEEETHPARAWRWQWLATAAAVVAAIFLALWWPRGTEPVLVEPQRPRVAVQPRPMAPVTAAPEQPRAPYARAEWGALVGDALARKRLPFPKDLAALRGVSETLRGERESRAGALSPAGIVVDETRPRFSWPAVHGASYEVLVYASDREVARSGRLPMARWTPLRELVRGTTYVWQVEVSAGDELYVLPAPQDPEAAFRVVGQQEHDAIVEALRMYPDDSLLHAVLYARAGLREDALGALRRAAQNRPEVKPLAEAYAG